MSLQDGALAALDLLSITNFVNYFGKSNSVEEVISKLFFFWLKNNALTWNQNSSPGINAKRQDQVGYLWTRKYPRREITPHVFSKERYIWLTPRISLFGNNDIATVKFMRPREATDDWFNIMLLHQNRVAHSPKNFIPEQMLENFLDLIIWGHEHECKIVPAPCSDRDFYITQPGSSIATSLSEYEAKKK